MDPDLDRRSFDPLQTEAIVDFFGLLVIDGVPTQGEGDEDSREESRLCAQLALTGWSNRPHSHGEVREVHPAAGRRVGRGAGDQSLGLGDQRRRQVPRKRGRRGGGGCTAKVPQQLDRLVYSEHSEVRQKFGRGAPQGRGPLAARATR